MHPIPQELNLIYQDPEALRSFMSLYSAGNSFIWNLEDPEKSWFPEVFWEKINCLDDSEYLHPFEKWKKVLGKEISKKFEQWITDGIGEGKGEEEFSFQLGNEIFEMAQWTISANILAKKGALSAYVLCKVHKYKYLPDNESDIIQWINECNTVMTCHGLDGSYIWANKEYTHQFGFDEDKIRGKNPFLSMHPKDIGKTQEALKTLNDKKELRSFVNRIIKSDGYFAHIKWSCNIINNKIYCILEDVSSEMNANEEKAKKSKFNDVLRNITINYLTLPDHRLDEAIQKSLTLLGVELEVDRTYIFEYNPDRDTVSNTYEWCNSNIESQIQNLQNLPMSLLAQWKAAHMENNVYIIPDVSQSKDESERLILEAQGIKSLIAIPLLDGKKYLGFVGVDSVRDYQAYSKEELLILQAYGNIIVSLTLRRKLYALLNSNKRLSQQLEENLLAGTWEVDILNNKTYWSSGVYLIHEVDEDYQHSLQSGLEFYHEEDKPIIRKAIFDAIEHQLDFDINARIISAKNNVRMVRVIGNVIAKNGETLKISGILQDITSQGYL